MVNKAGNDERVADIVSKALRQHPAKRESYLRLVCNDDQDLYQETAAAVKLEERMGSFLMLPATVTREFPRPFETGQIISERFEILQETGEGGMGVVYEAFDRKRGHRIAIKSAKPGFHRLLSPELENALKVRHPHVCLVNEIHTTQTIHGEIDFLTMEFLEGDTLAQRLAAVGKLPKQEALEIACQLCAGLAEAHRSDVLHRDFKSANIILCSGSNGVRAVITDFGLASNTTQSGEIGGTPRYMAPELWRGEKATKASDIYSLGVVLYEMVAGRPPFADEADRRTGRPPPAATLAKALGTRWDRAILDCLRPAPEDRPADAALVLSALKKKPIRKAPLLALILVVAASLAAPQVRGWVRDRIWPPPEVRLAVLPSEGPADTAAMAGGVLQDVSDRIGHLRSGRQTVAVISPSEALSNSVQTPEQANQILHATHALETKVHREGDEVTLQASVIDLSTHVPLRLLSSRYSPATVGSMPEALAGAVSAALRLRGTAAAGTLSPDATAFYDRGLYLLRRDDQSFDEAIPQFEQAARLNPRSPQPLAALTEAELMRFQATAEHGSFEDAQRYLNAAESLNPDSVSVLLAAGLLHQTTGQYEKALEDFRRVQDLEPGNADAFLRSASVYYRLDMDNQAVEDYRKAIALEPGYYKPYQRLGSFYYYRGQYLEAAEQFQKTIDRAPGLFEAYTDLGAAMSDLGRHQEAERALLMSLKLRETARAWNSLGAIRAYQDRDADAVKYYTRAVTMDPGEYLYWLNLGDSNRRSGRLADAKLAYRKGLNLALIELRGNPRLGLTRAHVAYFAARLGDVKRGQDEISQALELLPGDTEVILNAVLTYETLGERDQAIKVLGLATPEVLKKLNRKPDLADFRQDVRFIQAVAQIKEGR
jgi:serine/threonine protein kinase/tetratricopeptide (TPR) repeat protein